MRLTHCARGVCCDAGTRGERSQAQWWAGGVDQLSFQPLDQLQQVKQQAAPGECTHLAFRHAGPR